MGEKKYSDNDMRLYRAVGKQISLRRAEWEYSRAALEALAGMRSGSLAHIEAGDTACPLHTLAQLAEVFDCTLDDLVPVLTEPK